MDRRVGSIRRIERGDAFHSRTSGMFAASLVAATAAFFAFTRLPLNFDTGSADFNPMIFVPVALLAVAAYNLAQAARGWSRERKFGTSAFEMQGERVRVGSRLEGRILTPRPLAPRSGYALVLRCIESVSYRSGNDPSTRTRDEMRWEGNATVDARALDPGAGIPVEFAIPASLRATLESPGRNLRWTLEIRAELDGVDDYAILGVPVTT